MKNIFFVAVLLLLSVTILSNAQDKKMMDMKKKTGKEVLKNKEVVNSDNAKTIDKKGKVEESVKMANNKVCPVSGEELENNDVTYTYKGVTYGLCCKKCLAKVKKDPDKYLSKLSTDGKSL
ncbi:MAG: hypothetical protein NTX22_15285 [Ignavibacteriales bacterium]|nr:hypothetical protein [Ignavibacteriales bacterium]